MKTFTFLAEAKIYNRQELSPDVNQLIDMAHDSAKKAYSPYSHFQVGAAILLNNGKIISGNNQENAAYPSGTCAERTAAFYASSLYPEIPFSKLVVSAINPNEKLIQPISPCGACRQVLLEYEQKFNQQIEVILAAEGEEVYMFQSIHELLPFSFHSGYLSI